MAAEWKDIFAVVSGVLARQPPPVQIFVGLGVAFILVMFVEGLRVSFLPYRLRKDVRLLEAMRAREPSPSFAARADPEIYRAQRSSLVRNRKVVETTPRRHRVLRPKIRRISSSFEMVTPEFREQPSDFGGWASKSENVP